MPKVYISGPITGIPNFNASSFCDAERSLYYSGYDIANPLRINNVINHLNEVTVTLEEHSKYPREHYLKNDVAQLIKCDYIFFLGGWENSKGALFERQIAQELKIPTLYKSEKDGVITFYK